MASEAIIEQPHKQRLGFSGRVGIMVGSILMTAGGAAMHESANAESARSPEPVAVGNQPEALVAVVPCDQEYYWNEETGNWVANPNYPCKTPTTTKPKPPPTTAPHGTNPPPTTKPAPGTTKPPAVTIPYGQRDNDGDGVNNDNDKCDDVPDPGQANFDGDNDGDACDVDSDNDWFTPYVPDTDPQYDYLDLSVGTGYAGVAVAAGQGINVDPSTPDGARNNQIAMSVAPGDWQTVINNYKAYGVDVMATTTTTTEVATTTTEEPTTTTEEPITTTTTLVKSPTTTEAKQETTSTTEAAVVVGGGPSDSEEDKGPTGRGFLLATIIGLGVATSEEVIRRNWLGRQARDKHKKSKPGFGGTATAGASGGN